MKTVAEFIVLRMYEEMYGRGSMYGFQGVLLHNCVSTLKRKRLELVNFNIFSFPLNKSL